MKWLHALQLGIEILNDVQLVLAGQSAGFSFNWGGVIFDVQARPRTVTLSTSPAGEPANPPVA